MSKIISVGIIGYGIVGKRRRLNIDKHRFMKVVAVCDVRFKINEKMVSNNTVSSDYKEVEISSKNNPFSSKMSDGTLFYNNYDLMLNDISLDAVFICLPNYLAAELTIKALKLDLHVFCEKPPGRTVRDIENVIREEKKHPNLKLKYGFNHRYHGSVMAAKKIIDDKKFGKLINIRGVYGKSSVVPFNGEWRSIRKLSGGGILLDQGIHMLDMFQLFCGNFTDVKSFISNNYWNHDVEDNAYAILRNDKGQVAMIHSSATQWQHSFRLELSFEEGCVELTGILSGSKSYGQEKLNIIKRTKKSIVGSQTNSETIFLNDTSWKDEIDDFANVILNNLNVTTGSSSDALEVMRLVHKIYDADKLWKDNFLKK